jgi:hypothetical protein
MVAAGPRIALALVDEIGRLDDGKRPIAEICRSVGALAESRGLTRPSYEAVRALVHVLRELRTGGPSSDLATAWKVGVRGGYLIGLDQLVRAARKPT